MTDKPKVTLDEDCAEQMAKGLPEGEWRIERGHRHSREGEYWFEAATGEWVGPSTGRGSVAWGLHAVPVAPVQEAKFMVKAQATIYKDGCVYGGFVVLGDSAARTLVGADDPNRCLMAGETRVIEVEIEVDDVVIGQDMTDIDQAQT